MRRVRKEFVAWRPVFWVTKPQDLKVSVRIDIIEGSERLHEILEGRWPNVDMGGLNSPSAWHGFVKEVMWAARSRTDWDVEDKIYVEANYRSTDGKKLNYARLVVSPLAYDVTPFVGTAGGARAIPYTYGDGGKGWVTIYPDLPQRDPSDINI